MPETADITTPELEKEYERWLREEKLRLYEPHNKQLLFHKSLAKTRGLFGGNQSGKTWAGCMEIAMTVGKVHPYRPNYKVPVWARDCCKTLSIMRTVLLETYKQILPRKPALLDGKTFEGEPRRWPGLRGGTWKSAWNDDDKALHLDNGSFIEFKSYDQKYEAFAGAKRHIIREDEEPRDIKIHTENLSRQMTTGRNFLHTMTPINYTAWLYTDVYEAAAVRDDIDVFQMSSSENPYADPEVLEAMERDISDPIERAARLHGEFTYAQGRVWKDYGQHNLLPAQPIPREWHRTLVIDPHPEKPTAVNWIAEDQDEILYVYREADISGTVQEISDRIKVDCAGEIIDLVLMDPSSKQSATIRGQGSLVDEFRKHFPAIILANNARELGWEVVRQRVRNNVGGGPRLYVMDNCPITHFQMKNYSWKPPLASGESRSKPEVRKVNDDHCDCVRYRCMAQFANRRDSGSVPGVRIYGN